MYWSMLLIVMGLYLNKHTISSILTPTQQSLYVLPVTLCHTLASIGIGCFSVTGAAVYVGGQIPSLILSVGTHTIFAMLWWRLLLRTYTYQSMSSTVNELQQLIRPTITYNQQSWSFQLSSMYLLCWSSLLGIYPLFLYIMFDHPVLSTSFDPTQHITTYMYGIIHSIYYTAGISIQYITTDELNELSLTFMIAAAGSAMFGISILISVIYLLSHTSYNQSLTNQLHDALTIGHIIQTLIFMNWFGRPKIYNTDNVAVMTHALTVRWFPIILINLILAWIHYTVRSTQTIGHQNNNTTPISTCSRKKQ